MSEKRRFPTRNIKQEPNKKAKTSQKCTKVENPDEETTHSTNISFDDFHTICRVCLNKNALTPFTDLEIIETFKNLTKINIEPGDGLPDNLCTECLEQLEKINALIIKSQHSNTILQKVLYNVQIKTQFGDELKQEAFFSPAAFSDNESSANEDADEDYAPDSPKREQLTKCEYCGGSYKNLKTHSKKCDSQRLQCGSCRLVFGDRTEYNSHMATHNKKRFMCHVCSRFCNSKSILAKHLKHHEEQNRVDIYEKGRGRPKLIEKDKLELCLSRNLTGKQIAKQLGVSMSCVYKTCYMHGIKLLRSRYTEIEDEELQKEMEMLHKQFPNSGSEMMNGHLLAKGICVQRKRIRQLLSKIDPNGTAHRLGTPTNRKSIKNETQSVIAIARKSYQVPAPNSLWHMDANLKLARWGLVTHGCIDGYSRLVLYLECKTSSLAQSIVPLFTTAIKMYGLPTNVQSDHGYEQTLPTLITNALRNVNADFTNVEKPAHNQRIKKLWIDIYKQVIDAFFKDLTQLEESGDLNCDNDLHKIALHTVYLREINRKLCLFVQAWNSHKIRTASGKSPIQIFTSIIEPKDLSNEIDLVLNKEDLRVNVVTSAHLFKNNEDLLAKYGEDARVERILHSNLEPKTKYLELLDYLKS